MFELMAAPSRVFVNIGDNPELVALMVDKNPDSINES